MELDHNSKALITGANGGIGCAIARALKLAGVNLIVSGRRPDALAEIASWTGVGLRSLINLFNPEMIVVGGTLAQVWPSIGDRVEEILSRRALLAPRADVAVLPARLGRDSSLIGAAELAFEAVLEDPQSAVQCIAAS